MKTKFTLILCTLVLALAACSTGKKAATDPTTLNSTEWRLKMVVSKETSEMIVPDAAKTPTLLISEDGKTFSGFGGCNQYSGAVTSLKFPHVKFGQTMSTKMFCDGGSAIEAALLTALENTDSYTVVNGELRLIQGNNILATFEK